MVCIFRIYSRLSIQTILFLCDGDCLVKHGILENVALLQKQTKTYNCLFWLFYTTQKQ